MPEMDGAAFLEVFERTSVLKRIPVLIVSSFLEDEAPDGSLGLNIVGRLPKPVRVSDLLDAVRTTLAPAAPPGVSHRLPLPGCGEV